MNYVKCLIIAVLLLVNSYSVLAGDVTIYSKKYTACMGASDGVTSTMLNCIATETKRLDNRLGEVYTDLLFNFSTARTRRLEKVQSIWIKYQRATCTFRADLGGGGSMTTVIMNDCIMSTTAERVKELESFQQ